jgi:uncharacterized protein
MRCFRAGPSALFRYELLVPLILPEATSDKIAAFVRSLPAGEFAVSHWTRVEFSSLLAREVRIGGLDIKAALDADAQFEVMVEESFVVFAPNADDFGLAKRYLLRFETGLRAGDALHLAIASNHRAAAIYSLDKRLLQAGEILHLPVSSGVRTE